MKGVSVKKVILMFFLEMIPFVIPKNSNLDRPPFTFFAHISKIFEKYQMRIFFIEYSGSLTPVIT